MLQLQARDEERPLAGRVHDIGHRPLGGDESETGVILDVIGVEEHDAADAEFIDDFLQARIAPRVFGIADFELGRG